MSLSLFSTAFSITRSLPQASMFANLRLYLGAAISSKDHKCVGELLKNLNKLPHMTREQFLKEGSYYSELAKLMAQKRFQEIYEIFPLLEQYGGLVTPAIRLCKAACMLQLQKLNKLECYFEERNNEEIQSLMSQAIQNSLSKAEKEAYEILLDYYENF